MRTRVVLITTFLLNFLFIAPVLKPAPESEFFQDVSARESVALEDFTGRVVAVVDGDTIKVLHNGKPERVRLNGIDCPERTQAFSQEAMLFAKDMVLGKSVTVIMLDFDTDGRTIGEVTLSDGKNISRELVRAGLARWDRTYSQDRSFGELEAEAKAERRGLWAGSSPLPPWEWKKRNTEES